MNLIHKDLPLSDRELFFGPLDANEKFIEFDSNDNLEKLLFKANKFPSVSQAKKNGFHGEIQQGFFELKIGKSRFFILNIWE